MLMTLGINFKIVKLYTSVF